MNDYSQPRPGKISVHGNGLGAPSPEEVERRAREIAMIDERNPDEFTETDWKQARQELMGAENHTPPEETPDNADLTEEWSVVASPREKFLELGLGGRRDRHGVGTISFKFATGAR